MPRTFPGSVILWPEPTPLQCMYCKTPVKRAKGMHKGEHIFPDAIGGVITLNDVSDRRVCGRCNGSYLSQIDRELCSRSFLAIVASQELGNRLWQAWDVDHSSKNQLVEALPNWSSDGTLENVTTYPQISFEGGSYQVRGDSDEMLKFGLDDFNQVLVKAAQYALHRHRYRARHGKGKDGIQFEKVESDLQGYRLSPRLFTPHSIFEIAADLDDPTFTLRYLADRDKELALAGVASLNQPPGRRQWSKTRGSYLPRIVTYFDFAATVRGLIKIGFNLVAAFCPNTPVDNLGFAETIQIIRGERQPLVGLLKTNGYVRPETLQDLWRPGSHCFQLAHHANQWHLYSCFFGGRVCAYVNFPGINWESWGTATFEFPIQSSDHKMHQSRISQLRRGVILAGPSTADAVPSLKWGISLAGLQIHRGERACRQRET